MKEEKGSEINQTSSNNIEVSAPGDLKPSISDKVLRGSLKKDFRSLVGMVNG